MGNGAGEDSVLLEETGEHGSTHLKYRNSTAILLLAYIQYTGVSLAVCCQYFASRGMPLAYRPTPCRALGRKW